MPHSPTEISSDDDAASKPLFSRKKTNDESIAQSAPKPQYTPLFASPVRRDDEDSILFSNASAAPIDVDQDEDEEVIVYSQELKHASPPSKKRRIQIDVGDVKRNLMSYADEMLDAKSPESPKSPAYVRRVPSPAMPPTLGDESDKSSLECVSGAPKPSTQTSKSTQQRRKSNIEELRNRMHQKEEIKKKNKKRHWEVREEYEPPASKKTHKRKRSWSREKKKDKTMEDFIVTDDEDSDLIRDHSSSSESDDNESIELVTEDITMIPRQVKSQSPTFLDITSPSPAMPVRALYAQQQVMDKYTARTPKRKDDPNIYFAWYLRYLIAASHPIYGDDFQRLCDALGTRNEEENRFRSAVLYVEGTITDKLQDISANWMMSLIQPLNELPHVEIMVKNNNENREKCKACGQPHASKDFLLTFHGTDCVPIHQTNDPLRIQFKRPSTKQVRFHFGSQCTLNVLLYHLMYHFKYHALQYIAHEWKQVGPTKSTSTLEEVLMIERKIRDHLGTVWEELDALNDHRVEDDREFNLTAIEVLGHALRCLRHVKAEPQDLTHTTDEDTPVKLPRVTELGDSDSDDDGEVNGGTKRRNGNRTMTTSPKGKANCYGAEHQSVFRPDGEQRNWMLQGMVSSASDPVGIVGASTNFVANTIWSIPTKPKAWEISNSSQAERDGAGVGVQQGTSTKPSSQSSYDFDSLPSAVPGPADTNKAEKSSDEDDAEVHVIEDSGTKRRIDLDDDILEEVL